MTVLFRCIDLETAGLAPPRSVVETGWTDLLFDIETKQSVIRPACANLYRSAEPMSPDVVAVHHLTDAMLATRDLCTPEDLAALATEGAPQFLVAAWAAFEQQWVPTPEGVRWICTVKAAARIYPDWPSHSNQAARYALGLDLDPADAMPPHRAGPDSFVTAHVLAEFLKTERVRDLVQWTLEPRWMPCCPLAKHKGQPWSAVPFDYLEWIVFKATDMDPDTKHWAREELEERQRNR